ncbi:MAG: hypothetical protein ABW131_13315 [Candidatus Sedimenticola sp. 6PFRAG5]
MKNIQTAQITNIRGSGQDKTRHNRQSEAFFPFLQTQGRGMTFKQAESGGISYSGKSTKTPDPPHRRGHFSTRATKPEIQDDFFLLSV